MQVPSAKSLASMAVVKPEGKPGNGSSKPGGSRAEGQYSGGHRIKVWCKPQWKVDSLHALEDNRP